MFTHLFDCCFSNGFGISVFLKRHILLRCKFKILLEKVKSNEKDLKELNLNNIKDVKEEEYIELFSALKNNDSLVKLTLANGDVADAACSELNRALSQNQSLRSLSLENNRISPDSIADMFEAINNGSGILELHLSNQAQSNMG